MLKEFKKGFTLAEVLIVIGIIGVVAALTLPNLNHATGDKETVTRLQKAYSILNEANDRAVAIYGPVSSWSSNADCANNLDICWMKRIGEFLKISKSCDETQDISCESLAKGDLNFDSIVYQLADDISFASDGDGDCTQIMYGNESINDLCIDRINIDINGPNKGKNKRGVDIFHVVLSDSLGIMPIRVSDENLEGFAQNCIMGNYKDEECTWWVLEYGNLDYLKADESGKCNDSNIILDGVTNTSCH